MSRGDALLLATGPLSFVAGGEVARLLLARAPASLAPDRAQPLVVVTAWHGYGSACFAVLAGSVAVAALALAALGRRAWLRPEALPPRAVAAAAMLSLAACWTWPYVFSSDVYAYAAYGDLALHGWNPYAAVPAGAHDPTLDAARFQWSGPFPVCVYGPPFVALAKIAVAVAAPGGLTAALGVLRALAAAAFLASLVWLDGTLATTATPRSRALATVAYGLNPVALWSVAEGHNDAFVLAIAFGAAALAARRSAVAGAFLLGLSAAVKAPGALLAAAAGLDAVFLRRSRAAPLVALALGAACAAAVTVPPLLVALGVVRRHGTYAPSGSLQALLGPGPALALGGLAATTALLRLRALQRDGFAWLGIAVLVALPNAYPWYALWLIPLSLAAGTGYAALGLYGATISGLVRYLPDAAGDLTAGALHAAGAVAAAPLALALVAAGAAHRSKKASAPS